jgi:hypothetical protein
MNMFVFAFRKVPEIDIGESPSFLVCVGDQEISQVKGKQCQKDSRDKIGPQHPVVTDSAAQNGYDFGITGHVGCEIDDRYKCEKIAEQVNKVRDKIQIVIKNDGIQGRIFGDEFVDVFGKVENDDDHDQQRNGIKKSTQELFYDIVIDRFHGYFVRIYAVKVEKLSEPLR